MKNKKVITVVVILLLVLTSGLGGFAMGANRQTSVKNNNVNSPSDAEEQVIPVQEPQAIAVVNLDEGVSVKEEKIYYAEKLMQFPDTSFQFASLTEAEDGLKNGIYGAYVVIPADFSENVVSLNDKPQVSDINYAINRALSGKTQYTLLYNVLSFGTSLNNNLSYMYLNNVLEEFHEAQDNANTVINNDIKDRETIEALNESDLIRMVSIPELVQTDSNLQTLNIESYVAANEKNADDIDKKYLAYVQQVETDLTQLDKSGENLSALLGKLTEDVEEIDLLKNPDGSSVKENAEKAIEKELNDNLSAEEDHYIWVATSLDAMKDTATEIDDELREINENIDEKVSDLFDSYCNAIGTEVLKLTEKRYEDKYIITFEPATPGDAGSGSFGRSADEVSDNNNNILDSGEIPAVTVSIKDPDPVISAKQELIYIIMNKLASASLADAGGQDAGNTKTCSQIIQECDQDQAVINCLNILGFSDTSAFMQSLQDVTYEDIYPKQKIHVDGEASQLKDYLITRAEKAKNNNLLDLNDISLNETREVLGGMIASIENMKNTVTGFTPFDGEGVMSVFESSYAKPIEANVQKLINDTAERYNAEVKGVEEYSEKIEGFSPDYDGTFVSSVVEAFRNNNSKIESEVMQNNSLYIEYANTVYQNTSENINLLQTSISVADQQSADALKNGLAEIKSVKAENSKENQQLLQDFTKMLPYTRLGALEYKQAYEFITEPNNLIDYSAEYPLEANQEKTSGQEKKADTVQGKDDWKGFGRLLGIIILIILILLGVILILLNRKNRKSWQ